jgi:hypothetical protein
MTVQELIDVAKARLGYLAKQRETAVRLGDSNQIASIDAEIAETQETLTKLLTLE